MAPDPTTGLWLQCRQTVIPQRRGRVAAVPGAIATTSPGPWSLPARCASLPAKTNKQTRDDNIVRVFAWSPRHGTHLEFQFFVILFALVQLVGNVALGNV